MTTSEGVLALDQRTTASTALVFDQAGTVVGPAYAEPPQPYPQPGWVEHERLYAGWKRAVAQVQAGSGSTC